MEKPKWKNVDVYIEESVKEAQPILQEIRELIKETVPEVEEKISYNVPFYKYYGELVGFDTFTKHVSFGFGADVLQSEEREQLEKKGYKLGKGTMQIGFDQKVPYAEIKEIIITKARMNETRFLEKNGK